MKQLLNIFLLLLLANIAMAQAPQGIPYQAVARNSTGAILASTSISVRFTIRDSVATGTIKYREAHTVTTSAQGMFSVNVGQGTPVTGTFFNINWGTNAKFMQVEMDPAGGTSYIDMGTTQMMSVPYALNSSSLKLKVSATGDTMYSGGGNFVIIPGSSAANTPLTIGMSYGGGKIAYIFAPGDVGYISGQTHGLIAANSDLSTGVQWGCVYTITGTSSAAIGAGPANTTAIVSACTTSGIAAQLCDSYSGSGYTDWYLPSLYELQQLYNNRSAIGMTSGGWYWSSTEVSDYYAWNIGFGSGGVNNAETKSRPYSAVRPIRSF